MGRHADRSGRVPLMVLGECLAGIGVAGTAQGGGGDSDLNLPLPHLHGQGP